MNILPQILKISSKNCLVNHFIDKFKKKIDQLLENFIYGNAIHPYPSFFLELQQMINQLVIVFIEEYFQMLDKDFRDSEKRRKNYVVNKSNVP